MMETINDAVFKIDKLKYEDGLIKAELSINPDSPIFKGHFPGQPVVPGACMLQLVKEVLETALGQPLQLKKASQLKFISMIDPLITYSVKLELSYKLIEDEISVTGKLNDGEKVCFKFQGVFITL